MTTINDYYLGVRMLADRVGVDVWDINRTKIDAYLQLEAVSYTHLRAHET